MAILPKWPNGQMDVPLRKWPNGHYRIKLTWCYFSHSEVLYQGLPRGWDQLHDTEGTDGERPRPARLLQEPGQVRPGQLGARKQPKQVRLHWVRSGTAELYRLVASILYI